MSPLLLDTCAVIWLVSGELSDAVREELVAAGLTSALYVSAVSAWEVGLLAQRPGYVFAPDPQSWFAKVLAAPIVQEAPLTSDRAMAASFLPEGLHRDPADRLLVATARDLGARLVTRDAKLIAYAERGHLQVLPC